MLGDSGRISPSSWYCNIRYPDRNWTKEASYNTIMNDFIHSPHCPLVITRYLRLNKEAQTTDCQLLFPRNRVFPASLLH